MFDFYLLYSSHFINTRYFFQNFLKEIKELLDVNQVENTEALCDNVAELEIRVNDKKKVSDILKNNIADETKIVDNEKINFGNEMVSLTEITMEFIRF